VPRAASLAELWRQADRDRTGLAAAGGTSGEGVGS
jgi:hypothetical protein